MGEKRGKLLPVRGGLLEVRKEKGKKEEYEKVIRRKNEIIYNYVYVGVIRYCVK
jgi:hypothetical protein